MIAKDKMLFCTLLTGVAELYNNSLSGNSLEIYWNTLEKYSLDNIRRAVNFHVTNQDNGQFMPKPADLLRYIEDSNAIKSLHAWDKVVAATLSAGAYDSIEFDDLMIHVVIMEMGGWVAMCHKKEKQPFTGIEFQKRYFAYLFHQLPPAPKYLYGITEHRNRICGYLDRIPKPIKFGEKEMKEMLLTTKNFSALEKNHD